LDFGLPILDWGHGDKNMIKNFSIQLSMSSSDNPKSKIQKRPRRLKWDGLVTLVIAFVMCGAVVHAQQPGKVARIGFLDPSTASGSAGLVEVFRQEVRKLGWIEGKNITIEYRFAEGKADRRPELAAELVRLKVDLIVVTSTGSALAAKRATTTIPIVMTSSGDPVGAGLIASLARPGGNVTGFSSLGVQLNTKRLEILKDAVPKLARVGVLHQPGTSVARELQLKELRPAAVALKLKLEEIEAPPDAKGLESFFKTAKQKQVNGIMMIGPTEGKPIVELAVKYRLPAIYVDKILKGAKPADLPVQQATKFEFVINLKAAKQIGLALSPEFLSRANKVIK
jgi:putative ABC transport system substrate-binding protein